tara:strand:+ start:188 stop:2029 length:1842 start_codon:yes stop_codon:yes gene_type:complete
MNQIDTFFLDRIENQRCQEDLQKLVDSVISEFSNIFAAHHNMSNIESYFLNKEYAYHSTSLVIDLLSRLNQDGLISNRDIQECTDRMKMSIPNTLLTNDLLNLDIGSSRKLRARISNLVFEICGINMRFSEPYSDTQNDSNQKISNNTNVNIDKFYYVYHMFVKGFRLLGHIFRAGINQFIGKLNRHRLRVGYMHTQRKYMFQIPGIEWVSLSVDDCVSKNEASSLIRRSFYDSYCEKFVEAVAKKNEWKCFFDSDFDFSGILRVLFASNLLSAEDILFKQKELKESLSSLELMINDANVDVLFSQGNWFRFSNVLTSIVSHRMNIATIEFQSGGRSIYETNGYTEMNEVAKFQLLWSPSFSDVSHLGKLKNNVKFFEVPNPSYCDSSYNKKSVISKILQTFDKRKRILYSPTGFSNLFTIELTDSMRPTDISSHRSWIYHILENNDDLSSEYQDTILYIKLKAFGYTIFQGFEEWIFPVMMPSTIRYKYLWKRNSEYYFDFCHLHIFDGPSTSFITSLAYNVPSILMWNADCFTIRPEFQSIFYELKRVGILVTDSEEFNHSFNSKLYYDHWWTDEVQSVRSDFCLQMGNCSSDWRHEISRKIYEVFSFNNK